MDATNEFDSDKFRPQHSHYPEFKASLSYLRQEMLDLASLSSLRYLSFRIRGREELMVLVRNVSLEDTEAFLFSLFHANQQQISIGVTPLTKPCSPIVQEFASMTFKNSPQYARFKREMKGELEENQPKVSSHYFNLIFLFSTYEKYGRPVVWFRDISLASTANATSNFEQNNASFSADSFASQKEGSLAQPKGPRPPHPLDHFNSKNHQSHTMNHFSTTNNDLSKSHNSKSPRDPFTGLHGVMLCSRLIADYYKKNGITDMHLTNVAEVLSSEIKLTPLEKWESLRTPVTDSIIALLHRISFHPRGFNPYETEFESEPMSTFVSKDTNMHSNGHNGNMGFSSNVSQIDEIPTSNGMINMVQGTGNVNHDGKGNDSVMHLAHYGVMFKIWQRYDGCSNPDMVPGWLSSVFDNVHEDEMKKVNGTAEPN